MKPLDRQHRLRLEADSPFGPWLLRQRGRDGFIGELAAYAAKDRRFPASGTARQVCSHVLGQAIDEDMRGALEDALTEWRTGLIRSGS